MRAELLAGFVVLILGVLAVIFHRPLHYFAIAGRYVMGRATAADISRPIVTALVGVFFIFFGATMVAIQTARVAPTSTIQDPTLTAALAVIGIVAGSLAVVVVLARRPLSGFVARRLRETGGDAYVELDVERYARGMVWVQFVWFAIIAGFCGVLAIVQPIRA
ncbi:hypothetical protein ACFVAE_01305 [Microbacterium sp. NPDC057659]|uniref:hypothetical protein n=1 Tax=Microbacterium sp. NPDC057659 TaxID=3346198 RepID=UPI00366D6AEC